MSTIMKIEEEIKQAKFHSHSQKALINLLYTSAWVYNKQQEFFKSFGITSQQFNILRILRGQHPNCISATEIKSRMIDKNSDVSRLLERLALKNLVSKKTNDIDKRATDVIISDEGLKLLEELSQKQHVIDTQLKLSEQEAEQLSDLLDKSRG